MSDENGHKGLFAAMVVWATVVGAGMTVLWSHSLQAGTAGEAPPTWPTSSRVERRADRPTLLVLAHPQCPCSRATIGELARLMARVQGRVDAHVLFTRPAGVDDDWVHSDLWDRAAEIPGVTVAVDDAGEEARRFGGATSGQTVLYDAGGQLLFSGGITASRGHAGDNQGRTALTAILLDGESGIGSTPVFGCPLEAKQDTGGPQGGDQCKQT